MSKRWSCATLGEGFQHVMAESMHDEKAQLLAQVKETREFLHVKALNTIDFMWFIQIEMKLDPSWGWQDMEAELAKLDLELSEAGTTEFDIEDMWSYSLSAWDTQGHSHDSNFLVGRLKVDQPVLQPLPL